MDTDHNTVLHEFESNIFDIVIENLEVVTGKELSVEIHEPATVIEELLAGITQEHVVADIEFATPEFDRWRFFFPFPLAAYLATAIGGEEPQTEFNADAHLEPLTELVNQMLSPYLSELSSLKGEAVETVDTRLEVLTEPPDLSADSTVISFDLTTSTEESYTFHKVVPASLANSLLALSGEEVPEPEPEVEEPEDVADPVEVDSARFQTFEDRGRKANGANLNMLMDLEMPITIELGRTKLSVKDVLDLGQGSILELDKLSGDPVDVYINDRMFARGEVVVVDENFGVRITEILSPTSKMRSLQ